MEADKTMTKIEEQCHVWKNNGKLEKQSQCETSKH